MTEITAYHNATAPVYRQWIAYIVLNDGKLWGVYAIGATEEAAKAKISTLWESERVKATAIVDKWVDNGIKKSSDPWAETKHHRAGKIWMRHKETRELVSIPLTEIMMYEGKGYERSGPRSK